jgi:uncharacterized Fe-S cluster-containing radical SAM superfamily protein
VTGHGFIGGPLACSTCWAQVRAEHVDKHRDWHRRNEVTPDAVLAALREAYQISAATDPLDAEGGTR